MPGRARAPARGVARRRPLASEQEVGDALAARSLRARDRRGPCSGAERGAPRGVADEPGQRGGERRGVVDRHEHAVDAILDQLHDARDPRRDDRQAGRHRLEDGERRALVARREHGDVRRGEQRGDVLASPEQAHAPAQPEALGLGRERGCERAVAGDREHALGQERERVEQHVEALLGREAREREQERRAFGQPERGARDGRRALQPVDAHRVLDDVHPVGRQVEPGRDHGREGGGHGDPDVRRAEAADQARRPRLVERDAELQHPDDAGHAREAGGEQAVAAGALPAQRRVERSGAQGAQATRHARGGDDAGDARRGTLDALRAPALEQGVGEAVVQDHGAAPRRASASKRSSAARSAPPTASPCASM